jgi:hypothetical protein
MKAAETEPYFQFFVMCSQGLWHGPVPFIAATVGVSANFSVIGQQKGRKIATSLQTPARASSLQFK